MGMDFSRPVWETMMTARPGVSPGESAMRRNGVSAFWTTHVLVGILFVLAGCASGSAPSTTIPVTDVKALAGKWAGVADGPGSGQRDYIEMTIREDGSYDLTTSRTMGRLRTNGQITVRDGGLVLKGTNGTGVGSLAGGSGDERVLTIDMKFTGGESVGSTVAARLRPTR